VANTLFFCTITQSIHGCYALDSLEDHTYKDLTLYSLNGFRALAKTANIIIAHLHPCMSTVFVFQNCITGEKLMLHSYHTSQYLSYSLPCEQIRITPKLV
jgi:hypothetical protein